MQAVSCLSTPDMPQCPGEVFHTMGACGCVFSPFETWLLTVVGGQALSGLIWRIGQMSSSLRKCG